ncbi:hypothetical protein [Arthrobacter globiformis]|uniref:hypothetical protein n=1 Tax=Arthrobacter globiformis TaxID=1665 RepID=UPI00279142A3|nr:hypothetical protein [Arthrobacter globiformis]MDQ0618466.1 hypothetical protein [Arthrobacter globiformis]
MNDKRRRKETHTRFVSGHVAQANGVHEQVTNDNRSIQEGKEPAGHTTTGHQ